MSAAAVGPASGLKQPGTVLTLPTTPSGSNAAR